MVQDIANTKISLWKVIVGVLIIICFCGSFFLKADADQNDKIDKKLEISAFKEHEKNQQRKDDKRDRKHDEIIKAITNTNLRLERVATLLEKG